MDNMVLLGGLLASLGVNVYLTFLVLKKKRTLTVDARELLHDLSGGRAILDVRVIDPTGLLYRSPRG